MRRSTLAIAVVFAGFAMPAAADQFSYVTLPQAVAGLQAIARSAQLQAFCAPCGESVAEPLDAARVEIGRIWEGNSARPYQAGDGQTFWQVYVNDQPVDLAYVYVRDGERWENLALQLGLSASDVPRHLAPAQIGR